MVEQEAVNFEVAGSSPASRAKLLTNNAMCVILRVCLTILNEQSLSSHSYHCPPTGTMAR
jgi:hypothetical protein